MPKTQPLVGAVILAAGKSTRMKSKTNKMMTLFEGKPMIRRVTDACQDAGIRQLVIVSGPEAQNLRSALKNDAEFAIQHERLGTGHALMQAKPFINEDIENIIVLVGDHPFISAEAINYLISEHQQNAAAASLLTVSYENPGTYGRIVRNQLGKIVRIVENKDATEDEKKINEVNISTYCFNVKKALPLLEELGTNNVQKEYYITDIVEILLKKGERVQALPYSDNRIGIGINNRVELANALQVARVDNLNRLMVSGVTIIDPNSTYIDFSVTVGQDTVIYPFSYIEKGTRIGNDCQIGPNVRLTDAGIGNNVKAEFVVVESSDVPNATVMQPFTHLKGHRSKKI
ncbi:NTP transferase domain-containing protein [bacterium]|nr:NTP transferase domain-containing protein [bacterium]